MLGVLTLILCFKILGYYTLSENITLTRILKITIRFSMTFFTFLALKSMRNKGKLHQVTLDKPLAIFFYSLYLFLGLCSLLWSTNPGYSALQLLMNTESFVFVILYVKTFLVFFKNYKHTLKKISWSYLFSWSIFWINLLFLGGYFFAPDIFLRLTHGGSEQRLGGYFMNPNELGMMAVVGLGCTIIEWQKNHKKLLNSILFIVGLSVLWLTASRSSMIGLFLIMLYFVFTSQNKWMGTTVLIGAALLSPVVFQQIFLKQGDLSEVMSMTGRLPFWKALLTEGLPKEPLFGFGYMRIAYTEHFQSAHTYAGKMTHNTFIQVLMNLGFVGFTIVLVQLFYQLRAFIKSNNKAVNTFFVAVFIPVLINSFTEFGIFGEANFGILFYQFLIVVFAFNIKQKLL